MAQVSVVVVVAVTLVSVSLRDHHTTYRSPHEPTLLAQSRRLALLQSMIGFVHHQKRAVYRPH